MAQPILQVTAAAGSFNNVVVNSNAGVTQNDIIEIPGAGTAGAPLATIVTIIGRSDATVDSTRICIRQQRPIITSVTAALSPVYHRVWTRKRPRGIKLVNLTTLSVYEWFDGMDENTALSTSATGARALLRSGGIWPSMWCFDFHPNLLGVNQKMSYEVAFSTP